MAGGWFIALGDARAVRTALSNAADGRLVELLGTTFAHTSADHFVRVRRH